MTTSRILTSILSWEEEYQRSEGRENKLIVKLIDDNDGVATCTCVLKNLGEES